MFTAPLKKVTTNTILSLLSENLHMLCFAEIGWMTRLFFSFLLEGGLLREDYKELEIK
jgi:hypothetical protein